MLQGLPSYQTEQMPICGLSRSSGLSPVAMSIACEAPWLAGCVIRLEYLFNIVCLFRGLGILPESARCTHRDEADSSGTGDCVGLRVSELPRQSYHHRRDGVTPAAHPRGSDVAGGSSPSQAQSL